MLCRHILPPLGKFSFVTYFLHSLLSSILFLLITLNTCTPFVYKESRGRSGQRNALSKQPRGQNCRDGKVFTRDLPQPSLLRLFLLLFYLRLQPPILKIDLTDWALAGLWQQCVAGLIQTIEARTNPIGDPRRGRFPWRQRFCSFSFQLFSFFSSAPSSLAACRRARAVLRPDLLRMYFVAWHSCDCYNYWEREKEERAAETNYLSVIGRTDWVIRAWIICCPMCPYLYLSDPENYFSRVKSSTYAYNIWVFSHDYRSHYSVGNCMNPHF